MDYPQGIVTVGNGVHHNTKGDDVMDLLEGQFLPLHLVIDAVEVFETSGYPGLDSGFLEPGFEDFTNLLLILLPSFSNFCRVCGQSEVDVRFEVSKAQVFCGVWKQTDPAAKFLASERHRGWKL